LSRKEVGINTKKIIDNLIQNGPRSTSELIEDTGLNKDTIIEHTKRMKNKGFINKKGKKGKWYLTNNAYQYPKLRASLFRKKALNKILTDKFLIENRTNSTYIINETINNNPDWNKQLRHIDVSTQQQLSRFVTKIGCYLVYCFIKAMEPDIWRPKIDITEIEFMLGHDKDKVIKEWIENCIDISEIFRDFCKLKIVKQGLEQGIPNKPPTFNKILQLVAQSSKIKNNELPNPKINELTRKIYSQYKAIYKKNSKRKLNPEDPSWSLYELDKNTYNELIEKLKDTYPNVFVELDKIHKELNDEIKKEISFVYDPEHIACKGKIELVNIQTYQNTITKKQCNECKRIFPI
jgi:hypothetical protein